MKDKVKGLVIGITIGSMITGATAMAASGYTMKGVPKYLGINVNGEGKGSTNAYIINNITYVPIKNVSSALDQNVVLKNETLYFSDQPEARVTEDEAIDIIYNKIKADVDKHKLKFMVEEMEGTKYSIRVFEDFPDHIATYGFFYVDKYTGKPSKMDITSGEELDI
ncbi:hypothetical protein ACE41H_01285 [Paenibacillus enshidis]|uniref:PepSY domain-containing protein n=1 Tax=Paenibacillus enshidis TaxID=1458439 RepID=A0ABV5AMM0_9BACL